MKISKIKKQASPDNTPREIVVFHGTRKPFDKFNLSQTAQGIIWFTEDIENIKDESSGALSNQYILEAVITVRNPAGWDDYHAKYLDQLRQEGFDSIHLDDDWVVFDPEQVRFIQWYKKDDKGNYFLM